MLLLISWIFIFWEETRPTCRESYQLKTARDFFETRGRRRHRSNTYKERKMSGGGFRRRLKAGRSSLAGISSSVNTTSFLIGALIFSLVLNLYLFRAGPNIHQLGRSSKSSTSNCEENELRMILKKAAMPNKTLIMTFLNEAWIAPGSIFDLFLESFRIGNNTKWLLKHLLVISLDNKAHMRCLKLHQHCYQLKYYSDDHDDQFNLTKEAYYNSPDYIEIIWRRIGFLHRILTLGFNFVFTDGDVMLLRDPFPHLSNNSNLQIACDRFYGNATSSHNDPNAGFVYVKSDPQTIQFYKIWYQSRYTVPGKHDQHVFDMMKNSPLFKIIGLKVEFLDTTYFSGFCQLSKDISKVCTVHANCCVGLSSKVADLRLVLDDWKEYYTSRPPHYQNGNPLSYKWSVPNRCEQN